MRLLSWNVNGIRAVQRKGELEPLLSSDADIVCLQETKVVGSEVPRGLLGLEGWTSIWSCGDKPGYSGVATFVRDGVPCEERAKGLGEERFDNEGRVIVTDHEQFVLFNIYFPNGASGPDRQRYKMDFHKKLADVANGLVDEGRDVVICGDLNIAHQEIDIARYWDFETQSGFLPEERAWLDDFLASGWIDTFRAEHGDRPGQFTYWDYYTDGRPDNLGWRIDYFLVNERLEELLVDAWIASNIMGSDHCPVGLELELE